MKHRKSSKYQRNELLLLARWLTGAMILAVSVFVWAHGVRHGWHLLTLRQQIQSRQSQVQQVEELLVESQLQPQALLSVPDLPQAPPMKRLLQALTRKPASVEVNIDRLSAPEHTPKPLGRTRLYLSGYPTRVAGFIRDLEVGDAGLLVTGVSVQPGISRDSPTKWAVDGILP